MPFNRNIFTSSDISNFVNPTVGIPKTMDAAPPAGVEPNVGAVVPAVPAAPAGGGGGADGSAPAAPGPAAAAPPAAGAGGAGAIPTASADGYLTKLLKYVPLEILGAYLFIEGLVTTNVKDEAPLQTWLFWTLAITVVAAMIYMATVLSVVRATQIIMGGLGIAVYVFATGGWFGTTSWYQEWYSSIALAAFAVLVGVIKLPSLPVETPENPEQ